MIVGRWSEDLSRTALDSPTGTLREWLVDAVLSGTHLLRGLGVGDTLERSWTLTTCPWVQEFSEGE